MGMGQGLGFDWILECSNSLLFILIFMIDYLIKIFIKICYLM